MTNEQRKETILKKANQVFRECGFSIEAKDVVDKKFVISCNDKDNSPFLGRISSFRIKNNGVQLYPKFERCEGHDNVDSIILQSRKSYSSNSNTLYIFRNDPNSKTFFDFI